MKKSGKKFQKWKVNGDSLTIANYNRIKCSQKNGKTLKSDRLTTQFSNYFYPSLFSDFFFLLFSYRRISSSFLPSQRDRSQRRRERLPEKRRVQQCRVISPSPKPSLKKLLQFLNKGKRKVIIITNKYLFGFSIVFFFVRLSTFSEAFRTESERGRTPRTTDFRNKES